MERILQFGTGRFLRGFVEAFIDDSERARVAVGLPPGARVTVVETTGSGMAGRLAAQGYTYQLHTRGLERGQVVDTSRTIRVIDRSVDASERTDALTEAALGSGRDDDRVEHHRAGLRPGTISASPGHGAGGTCTSPAAGPRDPSLRAPRSERRPAAALGVGRARVHGRGTGDRRPCAGRERLGHHDGRSHRGGATARPSWTPVPGWMSWSSRTHPGSSRSMGMCSSCDTRA